MMGFSSVFLGCGFRWDADFRGANLANPYGLTSADKSVKTKEAKTNFE